MKKVKVCIAIMFLLFAPGAWSKDYNIIEYGAVPDAATLNTVAIQKAIDKCSEAGGGRVVVPSGKFLSGTILLKSNVELHFEHNATLLGSPHIVDYPLQPTPKYRTMQDETGFRSLIYAESVENIALTGNGVIDGQGENQKYIAEAHPRSSRSRNITLISCKNIRIEGLHLQNSAYWCQYYLDCEDLLVDGISVYNHCNFNNDAFDLDACRRVVISNCIFDSVDDGICLKSEGQKFCEDIVITNCIISTVSNAIKTGTGSSGGFRNISISNCVIKPTIKEGKNTYNMSPLGVSGISLIIVDGGTMEGISINNITIHGTRSPIYIRLSNRAQKYKADIPTPGVGNLRNISISNILVYGSGGWGSSITGYPGHPIENISFNNIHIISSVAPKKYKELVEEAVNLYPQPTAWEFLPSFGFYIRHAKGITFDNLILGVDNPDKRVPIIVDDVSDLRIKGSRLVGPCITKPFVRATSLTRYEIEKPFLWEGKDEELVEIVNK